MLQVNVLGPLEITLDGAPIKRPAKTLAMIAYLAVENRQVDRGIVAELLWPRQTLDQGRHSLRNALMNARKDGLPLASDHDQIWLEAYACDLHQFLESALPGLYRATFLSGIRGLGESWEEWLRFHRARCEARLTKVLLRIARSPDDAGAAIAAARRLMEVDPLSEAGCRALIQACWQSGDRVGGLRAFEAHRDALAREYGIAPPAETAAMIESLIMEGATP